MDEMRAGSTQTFCEDAEEQLSRSPEQLIHELRVHQVELETQAEELRRAYLTIGESRDKYLDIYEFAPLGYLMLTDKALIKEINFTGSVLLGAERKNLEMALFSKFITPEYSDPCYRYFMNVKKQETKLTCTLTLLREDGSTFPARLESICIPGSSIETPTIRVAIADISDIRKAEEAFRESEEKIRLLLNSAAEAIFGLDMNGNCTFCNNSCLQLLGYRHQDELLGKNMHWQIHGKYPDGSHFPVENCRIFHAFHNDECSHVDDEVLWRADGTSFPAEYWSYPQRHDGAISGTVVTFLDITERKNLEDKMKYHEQELMQFSKSLAVANKKLTLLSGITRHDILNQLTVLMGYLELLEMKEPDPSSSTYFNRITNAAERIQAMIRFTKEYEEIGVNAPAWQDCSTIVNTVATQASLGPVTVTNDLLAGAEVFADPLVVKVFYNLMDNAVRYGGKITTIRFSALKSGDNHLVVCEDDGDGVVAGGKEKIFERGFGKNTGLGLALSREILDITGITLKETGEPGKGARFEMTVPDGVWRMIGDGT